MNAWEELERTNINYFKTSARSVQDLGLFLVHLTVCHGVDMKRIHY